MEELEYDRLITRTSFHFKNAKEEGDYWDNLLIESPLRFKNIYEKYLFEKLLVLFSYYEIFKYFFCGVIILAVIASNNQLRLINYGIALIFGILSFIFYYKYKKFGIQVKFTQILHSPEFLELLRDEVIKIKEEKKT